MKKFTIIIITIIMSFTCLVVPANASSKSDYQLAKEWKAKHCPKAHIEKVITISKGGYKGKVKGTKWTVKYPKKVKKGKKVIVYMVEKKKDVVAMVCLGIVK